jgi:hypothetical protein
MIFNTAYEANYQGKDQQVLCPPLDPRYLYPQRYMVKDAYQSLLSPASERSQSLEQSVLNVPSVEDLMLNRGEVIDSHLRMLISDIYQRHKLQEDNLYHIDLDQCACKTLIYRMPPSMWDKKRMDVERKIIDLEQEKRREQTDYFRDILFLKKELRETLIEKLEEQQRLALLAGEEEESK